MSFPTPKFRLPSAISSHIKAPLLRRLSKDRQGVAALEFALLAPMLITMYLGLAELSLGLSVDRKVSHSASVAADMATQVTEIDAELAAELFVAALEVSEIDDPDNFTLHLESFTRNSSGDVVSLGAVWFNEGNLNTLESVNVGELDETMLSGENGLMIARVAYNYKPLGYNRIQHQAKREGGSGIKEGRGFLDKTVTLSEVIMFTPRESKTVSFRSGTRDGFSCKQQGGRMDCDAADDPSGGNQGANDNNCRPRPPGLIGNVNAVANGVLGGNNNYC